MIDAAVRLAMLTPGAKCTYCGGPAGSVDHRIPTCQGGTDDLENLVPACMTCNQSKGGETPDQWRERRLRAGKSWPPRWGLSRIISDNNRPRDMAWSRKLEQAERFHGGLLRRIRKSRKWSVDRLAHRTGLPLSVIQGLEQGVVTATPEHLARLSKTFLLHVDHFLTPKPLKGFRS